MHGNIASNPICAFVFAYAKITFSDDATHITKVLIYTFEAGFLKSRLIYNVGLDF